MADFESRRRRMGTIEEQLHARVGSRGLAILGVLAAAAAACDTEVAFESSGRPERSAAIEPRDAELPLSAAMTT